MGTQKEKVLITRLIDGDSFAFEELYLKYYSRVFHFALHMLGNNRVEAEGIAQEVFASIWKNRENLNTELSFSGYLFKLTKNRVLNIWRQEQNKKKYYNEITTGVVLSSDETNQEIYANELSEKLDHIIKQLPERRRQIFLLSRDKGYSYKKIAVTLNISENTVDTQIRHALKFLREQLIKMFHLIVGFIIFYLG